MAKKTQSKPAVAKTEAAKGKEAPPAAEAETQVEANTEAEATPEETPAKPAIKATVEVICNHDRQQILVSMEAGDQLAFRARAHQVGGNSYACSDWVDGAGTAIVPVSQMCTYRVGVQLKGEGGRSVWHHLGVVEVPRISRTKIPKE